jgi:hypothetical protein
VALVRVLSNNMEVEFNENGFTQVKVTRQKETKQQEAVN